MTPETTQEKQAHEGYPSDWAKITLMVSPNAELHAISGDRADGDPDADLAYIGLERINRHRARILTALKQAEKALENAVNYLDTYGYGKAWAGRPHRICDKARDALNELAKSRL